jgi:hypothetical protein
MLTPRERKLLRERMKNFSTRFRIEQELDRGRTPVVRIEKLGHHRQVVRVHREDFDIALAQLTLLGEL